MLPASHHPALGERAPRILIVRVGAMGDVLHGMPAIAALRAALPRSYVAWAVEPRWAALLQALDNVAAGPLAMPLVDRVHLVPAKAWSRAPLSLATARSIAKLRRDLRARQYDVAIDLQGTIRSAVIARMSGAPRVVGSNQPREAMARWLYTERVPLTTRHVVEQAAELVSHAAGRGLAPMTAPLPFDVEAERWCDTLLRADAITFPDRTPVKETAPSAGQRVVFIAPTAGWGAKQWPAEKFGVVARELAHRGYRVLVNAAHTGGDVTAATVVAASGSVAEAVPCTLPQLVALLRRVSLVIAGDSGPLHLAAALHVPVVGLFGPTDPARNGPWATPSRVLRNAASVTDHQRHRAVEAGLARVSPDEALTAALELLEKTEVSPLE